MYWVLDNFVIFCSYISCVKKLISSWIFILRSFDIKIMNSLKSRNVLNYVNNRAEIHEFNIKKQRVF
jgi:hypothetical protein